MRGPAQPRWIVAAFWTAVGSATFVGAFVLPFAFPLRTPVMSAVYAAGGNNRVGTLAVMAVSLLVLMVLASRDAPPAECQEAREEQPEALPRHMLVVWSLVTVAFTAALGAVVARAHIFWGDQGYFLTQLRAGLDLHRPLYHGFEFAYGPLLYAWPAAFARGLEPLGVSRTGAYLVSLAAMQGLGLALLFYVVDALPLGRGLKAWGLALLSLGALTPMLGLNYTLFRFALPLAGLVLLARQRGAARAALVAFAGEALALAVSPELGVAFGAGAVAYALYRAWGPGPTHHDEAVMGGARDWKWLVVAGGAGSGAVGFVAVAGTGSSLTLRSMAGGGFNLLLEPLPHVLLLLVGVVGLAPLAVAQALRRCASKEPQSRAGLLVALYAASLALLPAAFGRADPLHVFFNGLGFGLLALVAAQDLNQGRIGGGRRGIVAGLAALVLLTLGVNFALYRQPLRAALRGAQPETADFDAAGFHRAIAGGRVVAPLGAPQFVEDKLTRWGQLEPGYFVREVNLNDRAAEQREIDAMRGADFALVPSAGLLFSEPIDNTRVKRWMRLGFVYPQRREPYRVGELMTAELAAHWQEAGRFGAYTLYRRLG